MDLQSIILAATEAIQEAAQHEASGGVLGTLGINWKLFVAQLINFSIVLFVFWKWVVKPLGRTLTERQEKIEKGLKYSEAMEVEKKKFEEWKANEMKKTRAEADNIIRTAVDSATKMKQEIIAEAQSQSNWLMEQTKASIENEKTQLLKEVKSEAANLITAATERIIRMKLDQGKDKELISQSMKEIKR